MCLRDVWHVFAVIAFLNSRGAPVRWGKVTEPPPCSEWHKKGVCPLMYCIVRTQRDRSLTLTPAPVSVCEFDAPSYAHLQEHSCAVRCCFYMGCPQPS